MHSLWNIQKTQHQNVEDPSLTDEESQEDNKESSSLENIMNKEVLNTVQVPHLNSESSISIVNTIKNFWNRYSLSKIFNREGSIKEEDNFD